MSTYHYITGSGDHAIAVGKCGWPSLDGAEFATLEDLVGAVWVDLLAHYSPQRCDWTDDEVQVLAADLWKLGVPLRVWSNDDCPGDLDKPYEIVAASVNFDSAEPGEPLAAHLFGCYTSNGSIWP